MNEDEKIEIVLGICITIIFILSLLFEIFTL